MNFGNLGSPNFVEIENMCLHDIMLACAFFPFLPFRAFGLFLLSSMLQRQNGLSTRDWDLLLKFISCSFLDADAVQINT